MSSKVSFWEPSSEVLEAGTLATHGLSGVCGRGCRL